MPVAAYILSALAGYLLGSIPTGFLVSKARGVDIRTVGSGNIGATNVSRQFGVVAGVFVLVADALKGWLAVVVVTRLLYAWLGAGAGAEAREWLAVIAGLSAIIGHNFTCWLHFKGGKGIATSAGVLLALVPLALVIIFVIWVVVFAASRYVSLGSVSAAATLPVATWLTGQSSTLIMITSAMALLAIYKHKANIERLVKGTENRVGGK